MCDKRERRQQHRNGHRKHQELRCLGRQDAPGLRRREQHEREFAALRKQSGDALRTLVVFSRHAHDAVQQQRLQRHHSDRDTEHGERMRAEQRQIRAHPDGDEEKAHQQALERLDIRFELVTEFRVGEKHTREERAERHRQADGLHQQRGADHDQQRRGGEDLAAAETCDELQQRTDRHAAHDDDEHDRRAALHRQQPAAFHAGLLGGEQRQQRDQRNHGEVLEQQDRERATAARTRQFAALAEPREHDGGRRHREPESDDQGRLPRKVEPVRESGQRETGHHDLRAAQSEHRLAQRP